MKSLGKLQINSKKLLKNEELSTLRGGRGFVCYVNMVGFDFESNQDNEFAATEECRDLGPGYEECACVFE